MPLILLLIDLANTWTANNNNNTRLQRLQKTGIQLVGFGASALIGMGAGALISARCVGTAGLGCGLAVTGGLIIVTSGIVTITEIQKKLYEVLDIE